MAPIKLTATKKKHYHTIQQGEIWAPVYFEAPLINPKVRLYLEAQPRIGDNFQHLTQLRFRSALGYKFDKHFSFYQGYAWAPNFYPKHVDEQRPYQQWGIGWLLFRRLNTLNRFRLEERFIEHSPGCSVRGRYMLRLALPIAETRYYINCSDEIFANFNHRPNGPIQGFDQNRFFIGIGRQVNNHMRIEYGYKMQYIYGHHQANNHLNHIFNTRLLFDI